MSFEEGHFEDKIAGEKLKKQAFTGFKYLKNQPYMVSTNLMVTNVGKTQY